MKVTRSMAGALLAGFLWPGVVLAQYDDLAPELRQPASIGSTELETGDYAYAAQEKPARASPSPSDQPAESKVKTGAKVEPEPQAEPSPVYYPPASTGRRGSRCCHDGKLADPWKLFPEFESGLKMGGWISGGGYANEHGVSSNGPLGFRNVGDGFTLDQTWFYAEKTADTSENLIDWGFRVDYLFGVDAPDTQSFANTLYSFDYGWDTSRDYGSAMPQLYGEVAIGKLSFKLGHFYTIIGYEVVPAPDNFFYSHAYTMYYGEPFTHTGVLATYAVTDDVKVWGGWTAGWDTGFENPAGAGTFLGGFSTPIGEKVTFTWAVSGGYNGLGAGDIYMNSFVLDCKLTDKWTYIFQHDLGLITNQPGANGQWYGINQYLLRKINDCWSLGGRFEWFRDDDGLRVPNYFGNLGNAGDYYALTCGLNWRPHANVVLRPELRYDWYNGSLASGEAPFDNGIARDQLSGGLDFIVTY